METDLGKKTAHGEVDACPLEIDLLVIVLATGKKSMVDLFQLAVWAS